IQRTPSGFDVERWFEPELGGDDHLPAEGGKRFAQELFVRERSIDFSSVEKRNTAFDGGPDQGDQLRLVWGWTVGITHPHAAEPESRDFQVAPSQLAPLHCLNSCTACHAMFPVPSL